MGIPFDNVDFAGALARIDAMITSGRPHQVVTANVDFLVQARHDPGLRRILLDADLVLCDGTPLVWASKWLGNPLPGRVAGSDLTPRLLRQAAEKGRRIFFLGAAPEVSARAAVKVEADYPGITVAGWYSPPFVPLEKLNMEEINRRIRAARPDILFVAFGCPKAEKWISMNYRELGVPVCMGVGATIDFLAGRVRRAPEWVSRAGLEWMYRLSREPRRLFRRYARDLGCFGPTIAAQWLRTTPAGRRPKPHRSGIEWRWERGNSCLRAPVWLDAKAVRHDRGLWTKISKSDWKLDLSAVNFIDSTGAAFLLQARRLARAAGHELVLLDPGWVVRRELGNLRIRDVFTIETTDRTLPVDRLDPRLVSGFHPSTAPNA